MLFKGLLRRRNINVECTFQPVRCGPVGKRAGMISTPACITEPDTALGFQLLEVRSAVLGEDERYDILPPGTAEGFNPLPYAKACGVALSLTQNGRDILIATLGFDNGNAARADEKRIVCRTVACRPFGDGHIASLSRPCAETVAEGLGVNFPATIA